MSKQFMFDIIFFFFPTKCFILETVKCSVSRCSKQSFSKGKRKQRTKLFKSQ